MHRLPTTLFRLACTLSLCLTAGLTAVHADVYGFIDERGVPNYSDIPSDPRARLLWRDLNGPKAIGIPSTAGLLRSLPAHLIPDIEAVAASHSIDPFLLKAVVAVESHANPKARSPKGAMGLTQLMPATAARYGVRNAYDVRQNLTGGASYLRDLLKMFNNDLSLTLAAYNAGENAVIRHGHRIPPYAETKRYVPTVLEQMAVFRRQSRPRS